MSFLRDLPVSNPANFTSMSTGKKMPDDVRTHVAYSVPIRPDEKKISNDNKPCILRFLEKDWGAKKVTEAASASSSSRPVTKKRRESDEPSTSRTIKTQRRT